MRIIKNPSRESKSFLTSDSKLRSSMRILSSRAYFIFTRRSFGMQVAVGGMLLLHIGLDRPVDAQETVNVDPNGANTGTLTNGLIFGGPMRATQRNPSGTGFLTVTVPSETGISSNRGSTGNIDGLDFYTPGFDIIATLPTIRMSLTPNGRLGIGTLAPTRALEVDGSGDVEIGLKSTDPNGRLWTIQSSAITNKAPNNALNGDFQIIDRTQNLSRLKIDSTGKVEVNVLQIDGGSDVAEPFQLQGPTREGYVVVIDETHPGQLRVTDRPYDTRVAGIVSGAGGVHPGLSLEQAGLKDGQNVALSGRVFAFADASGAPIHPGDLLTTAPRRGHCMKATDPQASRGAILGKAMSTLEQGQGLVLVLVTLQ